jgi:hypothetical protein
MHAGCIGYAFGRQEVSVVIAHIAVVLWMIAPGGEAAPCSLEIATVDAFKGTWVDRGSTLGQRSIVCRESVIERVTNPDSTPNDFIKLVSRSGQHTFIGECRFLLGCEKPLDLGPLVRDEQRKLRGASLLESILALFGSRSSSTLSRPYDPSKPAPTQRSWWISDAALVVSRDPIRADVVFTSTTPAATYVLFLCPSPAGDVSCGSSAGAGLKFAWQKGGSANLPFTAPAPGVFLLYRARADDIARKNPHRALVLSVDRAYAAGNPELIAEARDKIALAAQSELARSGDAFERYIRYLAISLTLGPPR